MTEAPAKGEPSESWHHREVPVERWSDWIRAAVAPSGRLALAGQNGTTGALFGALAANGPNRYVPWFSISSSYPAALAARDLKAVAQLCDVTDAVLSVPDGDPGAAAELVAALLTGEPVTLANAAGELREAVSRPAPPHPVRLWSTPSRPSEETAVLTDSSGFAVTSHRIDDSGVTT